MRSNVGCNSCELRFLITSNLFQIDLNCRIKQLTRRQTKLFHDVVGRQPTSALVSDKQVAFVIQQAKKPFLITQPFGISFALESFDIRVRSRSIFGIANRLGAGKDLFHTFNPPTIGEFRQTRRLKDLPGNLFGRVAARRFGSRRYWVRDLAHRMTA